MNLLLPVKVYSCGTYHPWRYRGEINPYRFDSDSRLMMDFKNPDHANNRRAVEHFSGMVINRISTLFLSFPNGVQTPLAAVPFIVAIVPSHEAGRVSPSLIRVAQAIEAAYPNATFVNCLERVETVPSAHLDGGNRSINTHMATIAVNDRFVPIYHQYVVVIDDVTTTGGSLSACQYLLEDAQASVVWPLAILETASY
jgi:hypothetical protein